MVNIYISFVIDLKEKIIIGLNIFVIMSLDIR
jgi:hypothetical protein